MKSPKDSALNAQLRAITKLSKSCRLVYVLFFLIFTLSATDGFCLSTRYQVTAANPAVGGTTFCSGATVGSYTHQPGTSSCSASSASTNTITWQWVYDGTNNISGATGTFVIGSATPPVVNLTAAQAAVLSTLSVGAHTLQVKYTSSTNDCSFASPLLSTALTFYVLAAPGSITGTATTCPAFTTALGNSVVGGTWTATNSTGSVTVSSAGVVTGVTVGTATISYNTGCGTPVGRVVTVTASPQTITGPSGACVGTNTTLSGTPSGGTWSSSNSAVATVNSSGVLNPVAFGTTTISYAGTGCAAVMTFSVGIPASGVTVTPSSSSTICLGGSSTFTVSAANPVTLVDQNFNSGMTGAAGGTWTITNGTGSSTSYWQIRSSPGYSSSTSGDGTALMQAAADAYSSDYTVTTLTSPSFSTVGYTAITLTSNEYYYYYSGDIATIDYSTNGGSTWTSLASRSATFGSSSFTAGSPQTTINLPAGAIGKPNVKIRWYYNSDWGYYWAVDNIKIKGTLPPFTYAWSGVGGATGLTCTACASTTLTPTASGANVYNASIIINGCAATSSVTVNANPVPTIGGTASVCVGASTSLTSTLTGGTWQSSTPAVGTFSAGTGMLNGVAAGTTTVSYTITSTGCRGTQVATVNAAPANIVGTTNVCVAATTSLTNTVSGGTWLSGTSTVATINTSGVVTGASAGLSMITYTLTSTGCYKTAQMSVNPLPSINVTPAGSINICEGGSAAVNVSSPVLQFSLLNQDFNSGPGAWVITSPTNPGDGISTWHHTSASVMGISGDGSQMMEAAPGAPTAAGGLTETVLTSPGFSTVGYGSANLVFNQYLLSSAGSDITVEVQYSINAGGSWTTLLDQMGVESGTGSWSASSPQVTVALPSDALNLSDVRLRWNYKSNYGGWWQIDNISVKGALPVPIFTWAAVGSATGLSCTSCATQTITPTTIGANVYSVTANSTCSSGTTVTVSVNALPAVISGASAALCVGSTISLGNADGGGSWSSDGALIASIDPLTGVVSGNSVGTALISYILPNSCARTTTVTVGPAPAPITGTMDVCMGQTTSLGHEVAGGAWSSGSAAASIDASGVVTGNSVANAMITYVLPSGCRTVAEVTVNQLPSSISGTAVVCPNATTTLGSTPAGGSWSSNLTSIADFISAGVLSGVAEGTTTVTYTLPTGCNTTTVATVNAIPDDITGSFVVCEGLTTSLGNATLGGAWGDGGAVEATVDVNGVVDGVSAGTALISYTLPNGCYKTAQVTVNQLPGTITGIRAVCEGLTTALGCSPSGGTWGGNTAEATIDETSGIVSGLAPGVSFVTYILPTGCQRSALVTVNGLPADIDGIPEVCEGLTTALSNTTPDGAWSSSDASKASVDASGIVTGEAAGSADITYTIIVTGCLKSANVVVNPLPADITGTLQVCEGLTTTLDNTTSGGSWMAAPSSIAAVNTSGVVGGISAGSEIITYKLMSTGCQKTATVLVNPLPADISGTLQVCEGLTTNLSNTTGGGSWSGGDALVATIDGFGLVSAVSAGTTNVTYTLTSTGCLKTAPILVNPLPADIAGPTQVCVGSTIAMTDATPDGAWSSLSADGSVDASGVVAGNTAGSATIVYTLLTGCLKTTNVVVNPLPDPITGIFAVCENATTSLASLTPGGSWSSSSIVNASIDGSGVVTGIAAGNAPVTYSLATGCKRTENVTVHALPADIGGITQVCEGLTTTLDNTTIDGAWSTDAPAIAAINTTGIVSGLGVGNANITYTLLTGCAKSVNVIVNPLPGMIGGATDVCEGLTTALNNSIPSGTWISASPAIADVDMSTGAVTGVTAGTTDISYVLPTGCMRTASFTVKALPADIDGTTQVCEGLTTALTNTTIDGTWSSDDILKATVDATGVVTGMAAGTANIVYTLLNGCSKSANVLVNPLPASIVGAPAVCEGSTTAWTSSTPDGIWTSSAMTTADVNILSGVVSGVASGTATITYALMTGCIRTADIIVNALPAPIAGTLEVCQGLTTALSSSPAGGSWSASSADATVDAAGMVTGITAGSANVAYTLSTGCSRTANVVVNALPDVHNVTGGGSYCAGTGGVTIDGDGSQSGVLYQLYNGSSMVGSPVAGSGGVVNFGMHTAAGTYSILATNAITGCVNGMAGSATVVIMPLNIPSVTVSSGSGITVCAGTAVTYSATPVNGGTLPVYGWDVNGIPMATSGPAFSYVPVNGDVIKVTLTSNASCAIPAIATDVLSMTVNPNQTPVATIAMPSGVTSVCKGSNITLTATSLYGGSAPVYDWFVGPTATFTGTTFTYAPNNGDVVTCKLTSNYTCLTASSVMSNVLTMATDPLYVPVVNISVSPGTSVPAGATVAFTALYGSTAGPSPSFQWYKNGFAIAGETNFTYMTNALVNNDSISCKVTGTSPCGYESFNSVLMRVKQTGIGQLSGGSDDILLMPNPNKGNFVIKGQLVASTDNEVSFEVTNMLGQTVYRAKTTAAGGNINERIQLDNTLANGMYILSLRTGDEIRVFHFVLEQ
jgi:uncharacterized protein YjdB